MCGRACARRVRHVVILLDVVVAVIADDEDVEAGLLVFFAPPLAAAMTASSTNVTRVHRMNFCRRVPCLRMIAPSLTDQPAWCLRGVDEAFSDVDRDTFAMVDWGAGAYETTAAELEPVAATVVDRAGLAPGDDVLDLACGTGNVAMLAAAGGARVVAVDSAPRLLGVARTRAQEAGVELDLREGDLLALPLDDASVDVVLSVFGVIFAADPVEALREVARVLRPGGRALLTAWVPAGPIDAMLGELNRIVRRITGAQSRERFAWSDPAAVGAVGAEANLTMESTTAAQLAICGSSPEAYLAGGQEHPMSLAVRPIIKQASAESEVRDAMLAVLREANEDPNGFLVHSPYVLHVLRAT
jgi:SAM-dependent methyltransferase